MQLVREALSGRSTRFKAGLLLGSALFAAAAAVARADAIQDLQGAWVMEGAKCTSGLRKDPRENQV